MASISDVARATGVSTATVSRALRGLSSVAEPTRVRIEQAAQQLGYVPSAAASSLATGRTRAIGLVTPYVARWFYSVCIETIEAVLRPHGYDVLLVILPPAERVAAGPSGVIPPGRPRLETELLRKRVDATVVLSLPLLASEVDVLRGLGHGLVYIGSPVPGLPSVGIDDVAVGRQATEHLLEQGHRRLRFLGVWRDVPEWVPPGERYRGFTEALAARGLSEMGPPLGADLTVAEGRRLARGMVSAARDGAELPTGLVCGSDEIAIGVIHELGAAGVDVPGQVSVIGVDDHPHAALHGLTTIAQPVTEQAEAAARRLLSGLAFPSSEVVTRDLLTVDVVERFPTSLIQRGSTAAVRPDRA